MFKNKGGSFTYRGRKIRYKLEYSNCIAGRRLILYYKFKRFQILSNEIELTSSWHENEVAILRGFANMDDVDFHNEMKRRIMEDYKRIESEINEANDYKLLIETVLNK